MVPRSSSMVGIQGLVEDSWRVEAGALGYVGC